MPKYLVVIEQGERNLSAYAPDVPGVGATGKSLEEVRERMAQALAVHLEGEAVPEPRALTREEAEQHATGELGEGLAPGDLVMFIEPAPVNPVSREVAEAIRTSGLTQKEVARRMGTTQSAVSRLADPFYWGHSVESLRRLSEAVGATLELHFQRRAA
ncbi:MAG: XRE family transcriptional regulator [Truepera sp.]|nr:XRE family transcriptional regulator [Truepera sp.]